MRRPRLEVFDPPAAGVVVEGLGPMAQYLRDCVETDLVEHPEWADRHLVYPHPASVDVLDGCDPLDYQVERLPLHRAEDRIEDVAVVFPLVMDRDLADFPGKGIESGNHPRVGARMRHEVDDVAGCDGQVEVECGHPFRVATASRKLGWDERRGIRHVDRLCRAMPPQLLEYAFFEFQNSPARIR